MSELKKDSDKKLEELNKGQEVLIKNQKALFEAIKRVANVINHIQDDFAELARLTEKLISIKEKRDSIRIYVEEIPEMYA
ncbi:hypothetical protein [Candidatus Borrarchaeum sp.]|uniref:hypothetical protein n=1 Tax=Candidatus Borrarchaeum sp. TaxID=2846742 RepID=UPI00257EA2D0|nr:hypothetical protein [Candidatus Borrarchaeum sp.]